MGVCVIVSGIMRVVATLHDSLNFNQIIFYAINQQVAMSESEEETDRKNVFVSQTHLCPKNNKLQADSLNTCMSEGQVTSHPFLDLFRSL